MGGGLGHLPNLTFGLLEYRHSGVAREPLLGKGGKSRVVPVGSHARNALQAWREVSSPGLGAPVFPGRSGGPPARA